jgi:glycine dehydrogenase subunit 1
MPYGPHTAADRARMLGALGLSSVDELFEDIPAALRASALDLPEPEPELELAARLSRLAGRNRTDLASFLGAGVYRHWSPPAVDQILLRGEWYTAYTPYQPEISQGTLQSIYEYQSLIAELVDLDVVSASHYDGAAATAEAALMACRATRRARVLVSRAVHPHYRETLRTYFGAGLELEELPLVAAGDAAGTTDLEALERLLNDPERPVAGVVAAQPNFLGLLEPMPGIGELAHAAGALFVAVVEPVSLAILAPPGAYGADIAAGEGQPLGIAPQYGGPYLGILATTDALVRQIPGRLVGMTTDLDGQRAFVMTMRAREQDIRRDRAASNICTNQALLALAASVYLATIGPHGLRDVAALGAARAAELEAALAEAGAPRIHAGPYLNEFAVRVANAAEVHRRLLDRGVLAGLVLAEIEPDDPSLGDGLLVCATEVTTSAEIAHFAESLADILGGRPPTAVEAGAGERDGRPVAGSLRGG